MAANNTTNGSHELVHAALGNHVDVTLTNGGTVSGFLYTVDPVTGNMVLLNCDPDPPRPVMVMAHAIRNVKSDSDRCLGYQTMEVLMAMSPSPCSNPEWITARRHSFIAHLEKYRIPFRCRSDHPEATADEHNDDPVVHVLGRARVEPPYVVTSVVSDNAVIRNRVRDLVMKFG